MTAAATASMAAVSSLAPRQILSRSQTQTCPGIYHDTALIRAADFFYILTHCLGTLALCAVRITAGAEGEEAFSHGPFGLREALGRRDFACELER